jgi:hypothetical protein
MARLTQAAQELWGHGTGPPQKACSIYNNSDSSGMLSMHGMKNGWLSVDVEHNARLSACLAAGNLSYL